MDQKDSVDLQALEEMLIDLSNMWGINFQLYNSQSDLLIKGDNTPFFFNNRDKLNVNSGTYIVDNLLSRSYESKSVIIICDTQGLLITMPIFLQDRLIGGALLHLEEFKDIHYERTMPYEKIDVKEWLQEITNDHFIGKNLFQFLDLFIKQSFNYYRVLDRIYKHEQELNTLETKIKQTEIELAQFEIQSLEKQIKPHFLFNTLNLVARLIYLEKSAESLEVVYALSKLLRYSMEKKELVRVRDELQYVKNYLFIQKNRYDDQLNYQLDISQNIMGGLIPALALQPLVENSIKHGLEPKGGGLIKIIGRLEDQKLILKVIDDGIGFAQNNVNSSQTTKKSEESTGTGLNNIEKRIKFYCGEDYGLNICSEPNKQTEVTISIPFVSDIEDDYVPVFWFDK
ncbi:MAG: hypothetical protein APF76_11595 [Desulfitibacter sp. BRH_c19]|nr:MAG: hypothetical protein APF76_11595 [Desulfitibacter sp. BRH_c19]